MSQKFQLPTQVTSPADVARLLRELGTIEDFISQARMREGGTSVALPTVSSKMDAVCNANELNLLHGSDREVLHESLKFLKDHAPSMHISFAASASPQAVQKIVAWLREHIDPLALVQVGLSPAIVAGCVVRTPNRQFDFSLRRRLDEKKPLLIEQIRALDTSRTETEGQTA